MVAPRGDEREAEAGCSARACSAGVATCPALEPPAGSELLRTVVVWVHVVLLKLVPLNVGGHGPYPVCTHAMLHACNYGFEGVLFIFWAVGIPSWFNHDQGEFSPEGTFFILLSFRGAPVQRGGKTIQEASKTSV